MKSLLKDINILFITGKKSRAQNRITGVILNLCQSAKRPCLIFSTPNTVTSFKQLLPTVGNEYMLIVTGLPKTAAESDAILECIKETGLMSTTKLLEVRSEDSEKTHWDAHKEEIARAWILQEAYLDIQYDLRSHMDDKEYVEAINQLSKVFIMEDKEKE